MGKKYEVKGYCKKCGKPNKIDIFATVHGDGLGRALFSDGELLEYCSCGR